MKEPKLTKEGKLPQLHDVRARLYANDIMQLFLERLNNHTLSEVCKYIAGYFYRKQIASFNRIKEQANRIEQLESALRFMIRNEEVNEALAKAAGEPYVNKGLDFARTLVVMEKKDGLP
jgi:hypothetical protein